MINRISRRLGFARFQGIRPSRDGSLTVRVVLDSTADGVCVAFSTPRRIGSAVVRNRLRRQARELMRERSLQLPSGFYLVGIDQAPVDNSWGQLGISLDVALPRAVERAAKPSTPTPSSPEVLL